MTTKSEIAIKLADMIVNSAGYDGWLINKTMPLVESNGVEWRQFLKVVDQYGQAVYAEKLRSAEFDIVQAARAYCDERSSSTVNIVNAVENYDKIIAKSWKSIV